MVEVGLGKGRVVLLGFRVQHRAQEDLTLLPGDLQVQHGHRPAVVVVHGPHAELVVAGAVGDPRQRPVGGQLQATAPDGKQLILTVLEVNDATVMLDGNHPLAGQDLVFDIELMEIVVSA